MLRTFFVAECPWRGFVVKRPRALGDRETLWLDLLMGVRVFSLPDKPKPALNLFDFAVLGSARFHLGSSNQYFFSGLWFPFLFLAAQHGIQTMTWKDTKYCDPGRHLQECFYGPGLKVPPGVLFGQFWALASECPKECFLSAFWHF